MNPDYCNRLPSRQVPPVWAENVFVIRRVAELEKKKKNPLRRSLNAVEQLRGLYDHS